MESVETGGLEIAYERVGAGPLLVLVHGAAEDSRTWRRQLTVLADEFTVVAWDVHPGLVATLIMIDTYAGWKGSLPADEVRARAAGARQMLAASSEDFDPTLPGLFAGDPPAVVAPLLAAMAADVRPATLACELAIMTETDLSDLLPQISVPTLLVWGDSEVRSPLTVAGQFHEAIPDTRLVVITGAGHLSHLERPDQVNRALREFCRANPACASQLARAACAGEVRPTGGRRDTDATSTRRGVATNTDLAGGRARGWSVVVRHPARRWGRGRDCSPAAHRRRRLRLLVRTPVSGGS